MPYGPCKDVPDFRAQLWEPRFVQDNTSFLYAIVTKAPFTPPVVVGADANANPAHDPAPPTGATSTVPAGSLAGVVGLLNAAPHLAAAEVGYITVLPAFQRSHVSTHAIGLLLAYLLDPPGRGGIGLRRVVWQAHADNVRSRYAAERMGFRFEGVNRWCRVLREGKVGEVVEGERGGVEWGDVRGMVGRHSVVLSVCWDDWVGLEGGEGEGVREKVRKLMAR